MEDAFAFAEASAHAHRGVFFLYGPTPCCTAVLPHGGVEGVSCLLAARETLVVLGALHTGAGRGVLVHRDMTPIIRCILACVFVQCQHESPPPHTHFPPSPLLPPLPPHHHHHHTLSPCPHPPPSLPLLPHAHHNTTYHTPHTVHHTPHTTHHTTTTQAFRFVCLPF